MTGRSPRGISRAARQATTALHWGVEPYRSVRVVAVGVPSEVIELGRLVRIELVGGSSVVPDIAPVWLATDTELAELYLVAEGGVGRRSPAGEIAAITYHTCKGDTDAHWRHVFHRPGPHLIGGQIKRRSSRFTIDRHGIRR